MPRNAKFTVKVEGLSELLDGLEELTKATALNVQKRALRKAAEPIESEAKRYAPYRTGTLERRIDIGTKLSPRAKSRAEKESKVEIFVGPPSMTRGIIAEFGSVKQSPHPFMRPAWEGNKREALDSIKGDLTDEIEKARQRAARKAARQLAKLGVTA